MCFKFNDILFEIVYVSLREYKILFMEFYDYFNDFVYVVVYYIRICIMKFNFFCQNCFCMFIILLQIGGDLDGSKLFVVQVQCQFFYFLGLGIEY